MDHLFFFNDTTTTEIYTLSLPDALPILPGTGPGMSQNPHFLEILGHSVPGTRPKMSKIHFVGVILGNFVPETRPKTSRNQPFWEFCS